VSLTTTRALLLNLAPACCCTTPITHSPPPPRPPPPDERLAAAGIDPTALLPRLRPSSSSSKDTPSGTTPPADTTQGVDTQGFTARSQAQGAAAKERCLAALEGWSPSFLDIVAATPPERVVEHGLFIRAADTMSAAAYGAGRVVVLGDAAHPVRPTGGWGRT
jgi:2-polyprenyl-6-methoxyphenol hydroxylase-like FAD-dependent oxidoreductase